MSKAHYNEETGLFHEEHHREELAKVNFTQSVMEYYKTYDERDILVNALRDEIKDIPTIWIPYGTFTHDGRMFVYSSGWDEEEEFYFMLIDLSLAAYMVGFVPEDVEGDNTNQDQTDQVLH